MGRNELRLTARRGRTSGRNHMTINLVGLEGEGKVSIGDENREGRSSWEKPLKETLRNLCLTQSVIGN